MAGRRPESDQQRRDEERRALDAWAAGLHRHPGARVEPAPGEPRGSELVRPLVGATTEMKILYLHGGGLRVGSPAAVRSVTTHLAVHTGADVLALAYSRTPEAPLAVIVAEVAAARRRLADRSCGAPIALAGDSAGAYLLLRSLEHTRSCLAPRAIALLSPMLIDERYDDDTRAPVPDPALTPEMVELIRGDADELPVVDPKVIDGVPTILQFGSAELLAPAIGRFAARTDPSWCTVEAWPGLAHAWHWHAGRQSEADEAVARVAAFLREETQ